MLISLFFRHFSSLLLDRCDQNVNWKPWHSFLMLAEQNRMMLWHLVTFYFFLHFFLFLIPVFSVDHWRVLWSVGTELFRSIKFCEIVPTKHRVLTQLIQILFFVYPDFTFGKTRSSPWILVQCSENHGQDKVLKDGSCLKMRSLSDFITLPIKPSFNKLFKCIIWIKVIL